MEIERKWLYKKLPSLEGLKKEYHERYFVFIGNDTEIRVQKKNEKYEFERKQAASELSRSETKFEITEQEFNYFKLQSKKAIIRENYFYQESPEITIKVYHSDYEGLIRVEVEFESEEEAMKYEPLDWFGQEITNTKIGKDKSLVQLTRDEFKAELNKLSK